MVDGSALDDVDAGKLIQGRERRFQSVGMLGWLFLGKGGVGGGGGKGFEECALQYHLIYH